MENNGKWADPTPAAIISSGIGFLGLGALLLGIAPVACTPLLVPWIAGISLVCFVCGIILLRNEDIFGGTLNLIIGGVLLGSGTWLSFLFKVIGLPLGKPILGLGGIAPVPPHIEGYMWIGVVIFLVFAGICALRLTWVMSAGLWWAAIATLLAPGLWSIMGCPGIPDDPAGLIRHILPNIAGIMMMLFGLLLLYFGNGLWVNLWFGRPIIPMGKPLLK